MNVTKKRIAVIAGVALLVVAAAITVWAVFLSPPNKQDFAEAKAKADKIKTFSGLELVSQHYRKVITQSQAGDTGQKLVQSTSAEKKKTFEALDNRAALADEIGKSRVVRDGKTKKAYDAYRARETRYANYIRDYANAFPLYRSSFSTCIDVFQVTRKTADNTEFARLHEEASEDCLEDLEPLAKSPIGPFADYAKEFKRIVTERQKVFDAIAKKELDPGKEASDRIQELGDDFSKNDPTDALKKYGDEAVFHDELNALISVLDKKEKAAK